MLKFARQTVHSVLLKSDYRFHDFSWGDFRGRFGAVGSGWSRVDALGMLPGGWCTKWLGCQTESRHFFGAARARQLPHRISKWSNHFWKFWNSTRQMRVRYTLIFNSSEIQCKFTVQAGSFCTGQQYIQLKAQLVSYTKVNEQMNAFGTINNQ